MFVAHTYVAIIAAGTATNIANTAAEKAFGSLNDQ